MILLNLWCNRVFQWEILKAYLNYDAVFSSACCIRNILGYLFFSVNAGTSVTNIFTKVTFIFYVIMIMLISKVLLILPVWAVLSSARQCYNGSKVIKVFAGGSEFLKGCCFGEITLFYSQTGEATFWGKHLPERTSDFSSTFLCLWFYGLLLRSTK